MSLCIGNKENILWDFSFKLKEQIKVLLKDFPI